MIVVQELPYFLSFSRLFYRMEPAVCSRNDYINRSLRTWGKIGEAYEKIAKRYVYRGYEGVKVEWN